MRESAASLPLASTWVTIPASLRVTASVRWICQLPTLVLALLPDTREDMRTVFGTIDSRPNRFGSPAVSLLVRVAAVLLVKLAESFMLTSTVMMSPTWAAR